MGRPFARERRGIERVPRAPEAADELEAAFAAGGDVISLGVDSPFF